MSSQPVAQEHAAFRAETIAAPLRTLWRVLTLSPGSEPLAPEKCAAVSIYRGGLTVALGSRSLARLRIRTVRSFPFEAGKYPLPETVASSLSLVIEEHHFAGAGVALVIPEDWIIPAVADLPATVKENLPDAVGHELDRLTPLSADAAFYDFSVLAERNARLSVLVHAAPSGRIRPYIEEFGRRNLKVTGVMSAFSAVGALLRGSPPDSDRYFVHDTGSELAAARFRNGMLLEHVFLAKDGTDASASSVVGRAFGKEKEAGLDAPTLTVSPEAAAMFSSGSGRLFTDLREPVRRLFPADPSFASAAAAGAVMARLLLPSSSNLLARGVRAGETAPLGLTVILLLLIAGALFLYLGMPLEIEQRRLAELDRQIASRAAEVKSVETLRAEVETLRSEVSAISGFRGTAASALDLLKETTQVLPRDAWLTRLRITGTAVEAEGYAKSAPALLPKLETSARLRKVQMSSSTVKDPRTQMDRFTIKMEREEQPGQEAHNAAQKK